MIAMEGRVVVIYLGFLQPQKILRAGYFWPLIFKDCVNAVKKCHPCQVFAHNMRLHPAPLHPIVTVGPFPKWGIDFMDYSPASVGGHHHIIVVVDYFTNGMSLCL